MIMLLVIELLAGAICFGFWMLDPAFMSGGYLAYHGYPALLALLSFLFFPVMAQRPPLLRVVLLLVPFGAWMGGVWYIFAQG